MSDLVRHVAVTREVATTEAVRGLAAPPSSRTLTAISPMKSPFPRSATFTETPSGFLTITSHVPSRIRKTSLPISPCTTSGCPTSNVRSCSFIWSANPCKRECDVRRLCDEQSCSLVNHVWFSASAAVRRFFGSMSRRPLSKSFTSSLICAHSGCESSTFPLQIKRNSDCWSSCANGKEPMSRVYKMTPMDQTSTAGEYGFPSKISGATYEGVPHCVLNTWRAFLLLRANPKSAMTTELMSFGRAKSRFSSFKSRCVTLFKCMYASASKSCLAMHLASSSV
mmetsp:Transcript_3202/g.13408  ORF Transcript_3202/g.13408 Transcript_3202/m.13408 type:complete len:281 (+) Transcript_3202:940-1782(+)